ncbi:four helix bundle protein [Leeuwenhoekiella sp. NPDC079379]
MDNIAEGFGRGGNKKFINFLGIARGFCCKVKS